MTLLTTPRSPEPLTLGDGGVVTVRPLERSDRAELAAAIARLSDESRYFRFAAAKPRMTERELDHLVDVDHHGHEALLASDPRTGRGIAVARYVPIPGKPGVVELAVTVADEWQGRGLGSVLGKHLAHLARNREVKRFTATMSSSNRPAHRLMEKLTKHLTQHHVGGGVDELELDLVA